MERHGGEDVSEDRLAWWIVWAFLVVVVAAVVVIPRAL